MTECLLKVEGVKKYYTSGGLGELVRRKEKVVKAVDDVSFEITKGENFGLVGESGCGKSTLCRLIVTLSKPTEGKITFEGKDIYSYEGGEREYFRKVQMVFQASAAALNPRQKIGSQVSQSVKFLAMTRNRRERDALVRKALEDVGLSPAEKFVGRYPHELSGGQRQRVCIARAMISNPRLVVADEPVSSLDVSLKGQILSLMRDLQSRIGTTYLFVSHEIAIVANICDWIAVMYKGRIVELARTKELLANPMHPYTQLLLASYPDYLENGKSPASAPAATDLLPSTAPSGKTSLFLSASASDGCRFRGRCPSAMGACATKDPPLVAVGDNHFAACLLYD